MKRPNGAPRTPALDPRGPFGPREQPSASSARPSPTRGTRPPRATWDSSPAAGLPTAALADFVALAMNRYVGIRGMAPAFADIESSVLRWLSATSRLPRDGARRAHVGRLTASILTALVAAREALLPPSAAYLDGTLYVSEQAHASVRKAARTAGFLVDALRRFRSTPGFVWIRTHSTSSWAPTRALDAARSSWSRAPASEHRLDRSARSHLRCRRAYGAWVHADAAYGGFFLLTERGQSWLAELRAL